MENITLTINGKEVVGKPGKTILEVVRENGLDDIPTLCHDERIEPYGSCFLCVVEVEGLPRLVPACASVVSAGMVIRTNSDKVRAARKTALELLLSNHYADCIGPCINNCPAHVDAQGYIALINLGKYDEALRLIKQTNPLPLSIGRVCVRDCETVCRRELVDDPVAINFLKRFVADKDHDQGFWAPEITEKKNKRVAVVGGGPAGLTCAYYLTLAGYAVTIFEKLPKLGGMLRYGIPEYRLPKEVLDAEIQWILDRGIEVKTNVAMGRDFAIDSLKKAGYDAIFIGVGAHKASKMGLEYENETEGIFRGIDFLRDVISQGIPTLKGTAVVVGGGNTAIDAARTALRCGADQVKIVYRRSLKEMPAHPSEIEAAQAEGIEILFLNNPKAIIRQGNRLTGIECLKMKLEAAEPGERPRPVPVPGSEFILACDVLIGAIGQQVDISFNHPQTGCKLERSGTITVNLDTLETSIPGVFAGGDAVTGPYTAIGSIAQGGMAARSIAGFLEKGKAEKPAQKFYSFKHKLAELTETEFAHYPKAARGHMPELSLKERQRNFKEVDTGFSKTQGADETLRCLECGCSEYYDCHLRKYADEFGIRIDDYLGEVGKYKVDDRHPFIVIDANKCINCGRCVRTCSQVLNVSALGFVFRGFKTVVKPALEKPLLQTTCIACGNCIDTCPTGALSEKFPFKVLGTLPKADKQTVCGFCSVGCTVNFKVIDNDIFYVSNSVPAAMAGVNNGYLCVKGHFGHRYLVMNKERIETPFIQKKGQKRPVDWAGAIDYTTRALKAILDQYGPGAVALTASPKLSNEDLYLIQKLGRVAFKTNQVSSFTYLSPGDSAPGQPPIPYPFLSTASLDDLDRTDVIMVMNADLANENLIAEIRIRKARKNKARLVVIGSEMGRLSREADLWIDTRPGSNTVLLNGLMKEMIAAGAIDKEFIDGQTAGFSALEKMLSGFSGEKVLQATGIDPQDYRALIDILKEPALNLVLVFNPDYRTDKSAHDLEAAGNFLLIGNRLSRPANGLLLVRDHGNATGLFDMGLNPGFLPGYVGPEEEKEMKRLADLWQTDLENVFRPADVLDNLRQGRIKALLVFGEDPYNSPQLAPLLDGVELLVVFDAFATAATARARVVFPLATQIEQSGTQTNCEGRMQALNPIVPAKNTLADWQIIAKIGAVFHPGFSYSSSQEIDREIGQANRLYTDWTVGQVRARVEVRDNLLKRNGKFPLFIYEADPTPADSHKPVLIYPENFFLADIKGKLSDKKGGKT